VRLSVIIPALNEAASISHAIGSSWAAGASEVIVVDGGSTDGTAAIASSLNCALIHSIPGRAVQQNTGAKLAKGDVLLFLHADNYLASKQVAEQIAAVMSVPSRLHGALTQRIDAPGLAYRLIERGNAARVRFCGLPYGDQAIFIRRATFFDQGGFPEEPILEDLMFMYRLRRLAWPVLLPGPVVVSSRRWEKHGVCHQTLRNWWLLAQYACGAKPTALAEHYRRHDEHRQAVISDSS
jgi:rSAM/selenodomain-associated transferase 2